MIEFPELYKSAHRTMRVIPELRLGCPFLVQTQNIAAQGCGEGGAGGQLALGPKQGVASNLRNILKLNKTPSK